MLNSLVAAQPMIVYPIVWCFARDGNLKAYNFCVVSSAVSIDVCQ